MMKFGQKKKLPSNDEMSETKIESHTQKKKNEIIGQQQRKNVCEIVKDEYIIE